MHSPAGTSPTSVLIISNDSATIQSALSSLPAGHNAAVAYDLTSALAQLNHADFNLVICEIRLPELSGIKLLERISSAAPLAGVVMIFSSRDWAVSLEAMRMSACDCLEKPDRDDSWSVRLAEVCATRRRDADERVIQQMLQVTLKDRTEQLHRALAEVENSRRDSVETLVMALDKRENATHLHSLRVQAFTMVLAGHCDYSPEDMKDLSDGALLHDIGKIAIPDSIILKPGPLTAEETLVIKQHPALGYQILSRLPHLEAAADLALRHHERMDGKGYPFGLRGSEIPLSVRIFAVADALDVIVSGRSYCKPRSINAARAELLRCAGPQFDPDIVDVFLSIPGDTWSAVQDEVVARFPFNELPLTA